MGIGTGVCKFAIGFETVVAVAVEAVVAGPVGWSCGLPDTADPGPFAPVVVAVAVAVTVVVAIAVGSATAGA